MTALDRIENSPRMSSLDEMREFAEVAVKSRFYGFANIDQMLPLMLIAQSQGRSFMSVVEEYNVIQGRPGLKSEAMLARFQKAGGHIKWTELSDTRCSAIFSHPQCDAVEIDWDMKRAATAGLAGKATWKAYPRSMLKARVISDGVRSAYPACLGGVYTPEELADMEPAAPISPRAAVAHTPAPPAVEVEHTEAGAANANDTAPASSSIEADYDEPNDASKPAVQTMSKAKARGDWGLMVEEMRRITSTHELKGWGKMNAERVKLQPKDWQGEIRKSYQELMEGLQHQERAAAEAEEAFADAR